MRRALGMLLLSLLLGGCEEGKPVTPPSAPEAPPPAAPAESPPPSQPRPSVHGATGVGGTEPVPERAPPRTPPPASANAWERREGQRPGEMPRGVEAGSAGDAGVRP